MASIQLSTLTCACLLLVVMVSGETVSAEVSSCGMLPLVDHSKYEEIGIPITALRYTCNEGYRLDGSAVLTCVNGSWWPMKPICVLVSARRCGNPPDIPQAHYKVSQFSALMANGLEVTYYCEEGYKLLGQGDGKLVCQDGEWQGAIPTCEPQATCNHPGYIENGGWRTPNDEARNVVPGTTSGHIFEVGSVILYSCNKGYKLSGPDMLECRASEIWSHDPPICIPENERSWFCPDIGGIKNGFCKCVGQDMADLDLCRPFHRGTRVECHCLPGYTLQGIDLLTCTHSQTLESGVWDWELPRCQKIYSPSDPDMDVIPDSQNTDGSNYSSGDISDSKNKVSSLVIVVTTACSVFGVLLFIMVIVIFRRKKPRAPLFQQGPTAPPYARVHNNSMDEHDRLALMAYAEASRLHLPTYEEAMRPGPGNPGAPAIIGPGPHPARTGSEYNRLPTVHPAVRAANLQLQQAMAGDGNNNINNNNNNNSNRHSTVTTSTMNRDGVSETFGSVDTVNVSMSDASTSVTVETYDSGTSNRSMSSQRATAGSLHSSDDQLATDNAPLLDSSSQREMDVVSVSSNPSRTSKEE